MISLRALCVALSSVVVYNCITFLTNNAVSSVNASSEPQASLPALNCLVTVLCCDEVTPVRIIRFDRLLPF